MTKPFIKQKRFLAPSSEKKKQPFSAGGSALTVDHLNELHVFETLRAYQNKIFRAEEHLMRLKESCHGLKQDLPMPETEIRRWLIEALEESGYKDAMLRLSIHWVKGRPSAMLVIVRPFHSYPAEMYKKGVVLRTATMRQWDIRAQDPQIKCSQYVSGVLAQIDALKTPSQELIFLDLNGYVAEGTVSNIFMVKNKRILTPPLASGILRGVTRQVVMALAKQAGFKTQEVPLTRHDFYNADECFMTNTSSEVMPVIGLDDRQIADGKPGPVTKKLLGLFRKTGMR